MGEKRRNQAASEETADPRIPPTSPIAGNIQDPRNKAGEQQGNVCFQIGFQGPSETRTSTWPLLVLELLSASTVSLMWWGKHEGVGFVCIPTNATAALWAWGSVFVRQIWSFYLCEFPQTFTWCTFTWRRMLPQPPAPSLRLQSTMTQPLL